MVTHFRNVQESAKNRFQKFSRFFLSKATINVFQVQLVLCHTETIISFNVCDSDPIITVNQGTLLTQAGVVTPHFFVPLNIFN